MHDNNNEFAILAGRVKQGDAIARVQLHRQLDTTLAWIVRAALRAGRPSSPLARRILAEASLLSGPASEDREQLVRQVSQRLRDQVLDGLEFASGDCLARETVCDR